ncbi:hypothetical protein FSP39_010781 [Pinctada imbricata]|uniref:Very-long-chain (3R)-3-hydroxyacyl-CoA dehydratase n=1 Tax=Pinctada imbricata TaxID=66713 RepID=A0AA89BVD8_PINIB|nr:hypothetical protein FSP39_010781 [Pinctada imbricata]
MADFLSPFVFWGQKLDHISLKIDLKNVSSPDVELTEDKLTFCTEGLGVRGHNKYKFEVEFYLPVDPENSRYRVLERQIEFHIKKKGDGEVWPRLTFQKIKYPWLKIDFDKVADIDDTESEEDQAMPQMSQEDALKQIEKELGLPEMEEKLPDFKTVYLFVYNMFQFVGFSFIVLLLLLRLYKDGKEAFSQSMTTVGTQLMVCQTMAVMEIIHPILGLIKSSAIPPLIQVLGRSIILFVIIHHEERIHDAPAVYFLILTWSLVELIRYPFYMLGLVNKKIYLVTWLRYTAWIPLYPLGFLLEGIVVIMAIPLYEQTEKFSLELPNQYNMSFSFPLFLKIYPVFLLIGGYSMLNYMRHQRKKVLGGKPTTSFQKKKS